MMMSCWISCSGQRRSRHLGGEEAEFVYLGETLTVGEVPKTFYRLPFVGMVYFPGEAVFVVTFYGSIL